MADNEIKNEQVAGASSPALPMDEYGQISLFEEPALTDQVKKYNPLINCVGQATLMGEKVFLLALGEVTERKSEVYNNAYYEDIYKKIGTDFSDGLVAEFSISYLKEVLLKNRNSKAGGKFYSQLEKTMDKDRFRKMWEIIYEDNDITGSTALVTGSIFDRKNGKILIKFNADARNFVVNVNSRYTLLSKSTMLNFRNIYSFSLYQCLKSSLCQYEAYQKKANLPLPDEYIIEYDLSELKFLIRTLDVDMDSDDKESVNIQNAIKARNFEDAERMSRERRRFTSRPNLFRDDVLKKASLEINGFECPFDDETKDIDEYYENCKKFSPTDIHFRCLFIRTGRGGKVSTVRFFVSWAKTIRGTHTELPDKGQAGSEVDQDDFIDMMREVLNGNTNGPLSTKELRTLAARADWNIEKIRKAAKVRASSKTKVNDDMAWYTSALKEGYEPPVTETKKNNIAGKKTSGLTKSAVAYNSYQHREYSEEEMDNIEQQLLQKSRQKARNGSKDKQ